MRKCKLKTKCKKVNVCKGCPRVSTYSTVESINKKVIEKNNEAK